MAHKRITVVRALDGVDRVAFVAVLDRELGASEMELYVTEPDPRAPTAVVCSPSTVRIGDDVGSVLVSYEVEENVLWDEPIDGPVHSMFAFFRPPAAIDTEDFVRRYREHADVARVHHPGIRRYVQDLVATQTGEDRWACAAISELHFAGPDEYRERFWRDEESREVVARDVERFSDTTTAKALVVSRVA